MPTTAVKPVRVAIAIIEGGDSRVLLTRRGQGVHQAGKWEFPGGKVEADERPDQAMVREVSEEVAIEPSAWDLLSLVTYDYGDRVVEISTFVVNEFSGQPRAQEGQDMAWFDVPALSSMDFPAANAAIIADYSKRLGAC